MNKALDDVHALLMKATEGQPHRLCTYKDQFIILIFSPEDRPIVIEVKELKDE